MPKTTISVTPSLSSTKPVALQWEQNGEFVGVDGVDGDMLRGLALMLTRAADLADDLYKHSESHGISDFSTSYEIEWTEKTGEWGTIDDGS